MIELEHVTKTFGQKVAVDDLTLTIPSGTITGFIGPNGAGKTTTIHMMTGALRPTKGTITLNGINMATSPVEAKEQFALVPDSPDLFLRLTGLQYINFMADLYGVDTQTRRERIESLAKEFEMEEALNSQMESYSHGMRQKAIIMGALVCDPEIWILDEPMTGLDPSSSYLLKQKMRGHANRGKTVFFSTHVLEVAEKLCDEIILIAKGKILYQGTLEMLQSHYPGLSLEDIFIEVTQSDHV